LGRVHLLRGVEANRVHPVLLSPAERQSEQAPPEPPAPAVRGEIHALELGLVGPEQSHRDRSDHPAAVLGDPEGVVVSERVLKVTIDHGILLKPELRERRDDKLAKAGGVLGLEEDDGLDGATLLRGDLLNENRGNGT
jgi:hypothetical protein